MFNCYVHMLNFSKWCNCFVDEPVPCWIHTSSKYALSFICESWVILFVKRNCIFEHINICACSNFFKQVNFVNVFLCYNIVGVNPHNKVASCFWEGKITRLWKIVNPLKIVNIFCFCFCNFFCFVGWTCVNNNNFVGELFDAWKASF